LHKPICGVALTAQTKQVSKRPTIGAKQTYYAGKRDLMMTSPGVKVMYSNCRKTSLIKVSYKTVGERKKKKEEKCIQTAGRLSN